MTREIVTRWTDPRCNDADGSVEIDATSVRITNADGCHVTLDWDEYDRLVAEVAKLRPLVSEAA